MAFSNTLISIVWSRCSAVAAGFNHFETSMTVQVASGRSAFTWWVLHSLGMRAFTRRTPEATGVLQNNDAGDCTLSSVRRCGWDILRSTHSTVFGKNNMKEILQYLKKHGEQSDTEIAIATGISLANVRLRLSELAARGEIMACLSIKFEKGKKIEGIRCRLAGYIPPAAPGRKSKAQLKIS